MPSIERRESGSLNEANVPQALKCVFVTAIYGTAETVPFTKNVFAVRYKSVPSQNDMATVLEPLHAETTDARLTLRGNVLRMLPFLLLFYVQLVHHQLWRDEINAWGMVVASPTLRALFSNVHYEAHPALWYLLLYPGSKLTHAPWMLKVLEALIGTGIYLVLALATPLRRVEQVLVYLSSYILFEYTVMSRMYSLMLLFTLIYLWSRLKYPERVVRNALWLGTIANTDVTGMILSGALLLEYGIDWLQRREGWSRLLQAGAVYAGMVALAAWTLWPAKDISWRTNGRMFQYARSAAHFRVAVLNYVSMPWYPVNRAFPRHFWEAEVLGNPLLYLFMMPLVLVLLLAVFWRSPRLLAMLGALATAGIAFSHLVYIGSPRHFGIMFIGVLAGLWILRYRGEPISKLAYLLLGMSALSGLFYAYGQWARPFADDGAVSKWLVEHNLQDAALIGFPDANVVGVPEQLQRPMYFLDCACVDTYMKFSRRRDDFDVDHGVPAGLAKAARILHAPEMIFMIYRPLTAVETKELAASSVDAEPLAQFTQGDIVDEHFFLYKVTLVGGS